MSEREKEDKDWDDTPSKEQDNGPEDSQDSAGK